MLIRHLSSKAVAQKLDSSAIRLLNNRHLPSLHSNFRRSYQRTPELCSKAAILHCRDTGRKHLNTCLTLRKRQTRLQAASMSGLVGDTFYLDEFAFRQFEGGHAAQLDVSKEDFVQTVHKLYHEVDFLFRLKVHYEK